MKLSQLTLAALMAAAVSTSAVAQSVEVKDPWVRAAVPGQTGTGAFMKITARNGARLVSASSPVAGVTEVHEMKMEGNVMKIRWSSRMPRASKAGSSSRSPCPRRP
jgi:copper(I)-binding protein